MTQGLDLDVDLADAEAVADRRDAVVAAVREHAGEMAYTLARVEGGDYGRRTFETAGEHPYFCVPHEGSGMTGTVSVQ